MANIGMAVPGASSLGLGFADTGDETEEERRKRLLAQQQSRLLPALSPGASNLGLTATGYSAGLG